MLGVLALPVVLAAASPAPAQVVAPTGHFVYTLKPSVRIGEPSTPAKQMHKAAAVFWPGESRMAAVLALNGIADETRLQFGAVLRVPPPSPASAMSECFGAGLRLELEGKGQGTVQVDCDPCATPPGHEEGAEPVLALRVADDHRHAQHVRLEPIPGADGGSPRTGGAVTDVRAWDLPDGDVLLVVRSQDATGSSGRDVAGGIAFYRLSRGPRAVLLASLPGDRARSVDGSASHVDCSLSAAIEDRAFVFTVTRTHSDLGTERRPDQAIVRYSSEAESRQRLTYDPGRHAIDVGPVVEVARRHKRWGEGEPEPAAFTEDPARP